jgi:hypothetical protein
LLWDLGVTEIGQKWSQSYCGNINFGDSISGFLSKNIELIFRHFLKTMERENKLPEAYVFDTGSKDWKTYDVWPPKMQRKAFIWHRIKFDHGTKWWVSRVH